MSIEEIIREAEARFGPYMPEEPEHVFDPLRNIFPGSEVMFLTHEGIRYGTLLGYDGRVTNVRENYHDMGIIVDEYDLPVLPLLSNRDRIVSLDGLVAV